MKASTRSIQLIATIAFALGLAPGLVDAQGSAQVRRLTPVWRRTIAEGVAAQLVQAYFDRAAANRIAAHLRQRLNDGAYESLEDPAEFARLLTTHLREINGDLHLNVRYSPDPIPERRAPSEPTAEEIARQRERAEAANYGFTELRLLRPRIAYIRFDSFHPYRWSESTLETALAFLGSTSALILDLRYNTGGEADMVDSVNQVLLRRDSARTFILTSGGTASAAEAVALKMRQEHHATLIGEKTLGAGNAGTMRRVDAHFEVFVPVIRTVWDGIGVQPHVYAPSEVALERAQQIVSERLAGLANNQQDREGLRYFADAARLRADAIELGIRDAPFDTADAREVIGRYQYPASVIRVSSEEKSLIAQVEGRARRYSFKRRMDGSYIATTDRVVMRFLRNDAGQVIGMDWFEGGRSSPARRIR
jgi:hypothetical protein